jgi:hypothetical protein
MQIVVKAAKDQEDPLEIITRNVAETLGESDEKPLVVKVFPDQTIGHRARLYAIHLPDDLPAKDVNRVVERLSKQKAFEYAEVPAPKRPLVRDR